MDENGRRNTRRPVTLLVLAALLIVAGLVSAISAPGAPPQSNKADAYGGPVAQKPTNPQTRAACDKYYSAANPGTEARECRAIAARNAGNKKCAKKSGAARAKCQKAVKKQFAKEQAAIAKQRKAEKVCTDKWNADHAALDQRADDYPDRVAAVDAEYTACLRRAQGI
jgi:hypothetical protein